MSKRNGNDSNAAPDIKGGQKVVKTSPELAGLDDRTSLESNRSGNDLMGGTSERI
ncbi:hypothetical protein [Peribacillus saganii]|uniref:hypothetical protein n=1 Tax=Peribacillus saganii TaxID=2303992 RepID=UPI001313EE57|nr:hypothetical protein [Peribacillus saganii]